MGLSSLLAVLGPPIEDPEEEAFLLFSQSIPSQNLGFVNAKATVLELAVGGHDLTIHQSPTILSSNRGGGTTGAVVWKITPLFASWIAAPSNVLLQHEILKKDAVVLELGCGISGIIGLALASLVKSYTLTDQDYVAKLLHQNLAENYKDASSSSSSSSPSTKSRKSASKSKKHPAGQDISQTSSSKIFFAPLDWETDVVTPSLTNSPDATDTSFDAVIACDCIYNDALIQPLVQTCIDACKLRDVSLPSSGNSPVEGRTPTICIVAQQLRSAEVFESWLKAFHTAFHVWRVPDGELIDGLRSDSGFVIHFGVLR